jgi:NAD(P)H-dependent flavin oxidoreductase YrpB (nitropropane dioxygenase family)
MSTKIFDSKYPILEACMNKASTLPLALAVHRAGGYASLCSWTYENNYRLMHLDLNNFVNNAGSNKVHVSFELRELLHHNNQCMEIIKSIAMPTLEVVFQPLTNLPKSELISIVQHCLGPIKDLGIKVFQRTLHPIDLEQQQDHFLDGFCVKGTDAGGRHSSGPTSFTTHELFIKQKTLTPNAMIIPYGGIGTADQVKTYLDQGACIVAVGTLLAASIESSVKTSTKQAMVKAKVQDLTKFNFAPEAHYGINALAFDTYQGQDDDNLTRSLVQGLYKKDSTQGHVIAGHGIEHITDILPCETIIQNLCASVV